MRTSTKIILAVVIVGGYFAIATAIMVKIHSDTTPPAPRTTIGPAEPFVDPPGVTPQMRIDLTWECLRRVTRCE